MVMCGEPSFKMGLGSLMGKCRSWILWEYRDLDVTLVPYRELPGRQTI